MKIMSWFKRTRKSKDQSHATVFKLTNHDLPNSQISKNALQAIKILKEGGFVGYLVGGSVRDLLSGLAPKDFDVATNAYPEQIRGLFRNSRIIGRRFRLVHIYFRGEVIEVSTFRANSDSVIPMVDADSDLLEETSSKMLKFDNTYGTIEEDAWRRDFTVNALYYDITDASVIDYTGGMPDLKQGIIRMIGDPTQRFHEDPVRLLRAIRLAAKLNFKINDDIQSCLHQLGHLLKHVPSARLYDEYIKLFFKGQAAATFKKLVEYSYLQILFPPTQYAFKKKDQTHYPNLLNLAAQATDTRFNNNQSLNPGFLLSIFLWPAVEYHIKKITKEINAQHKGKKTPHKHTTQTLYQAVKTVLSKQNQVVAIPRNLETMIRAIWVLQLYLIEPKRRRIHRTLNHRYFRAAFDFLELRVQVGEPYEKVLAWWGCFRNKKMEYNELVSQLED